MDVQEDGAAAMSGGALGTTSDIPANNTDDSGVAGVAKNPPIKKKKTNLLTRSMPMTKPPKSLRSIIGRDMANDRRADKK
jgi:hypothetical protein